jgi:hypothetical protein
MNFLEVADISRGFQLHINDLAPNSLELCAEQLEQNGITCETETLISDETILAGRLPQEH